jgi:putative glutamine amidotransferase
MKTPLIGITCEQESFTNTSLLETISVEYTRAVIAAGGTPLLIPTDFPVAELESLRERLDGILLTGGGDIEPGQYSSESHPSLILVSPERDALEIELVKFAVKTDWPLLGICRGLQVMNVALHGTLTLDVPTQFPTTIQHDRPYGQARDFIAHEVTIEANTRLAEIIGKDQIPVNSFHHQAVREMAPGLKVNARSTDGLVEGLEMPGSRFFMGVQWHPECLQKHSEQRALFQAFIQAVQSA